MAKKNGSISFYSTLDREVDHKLPVAIGQWEERAEKIMGKGAFDFVARGAGEEATLKANRQAFHKWRIVHRVLRNVSNRDQSISLFGQTISSPILLAPIGVQTIAHPDGELASAKAAASLNIPFITSTAATFPMEEIAQAMGDGLRWQQLYNLTDFTVMQSMMKRAETSGYSAIVITVDTPVIGLREMDLMNNYSPMNAESGNGNFVTDPVFCSLLEKTPREDPQASNKKQAELVQNTSFQWENIKKIRQSTNLPILLKGIAHPEDAELAIKYGVDGIIVSNHGGRQLDHGIATLDALGPICQTVQGEIPVLMDGGIRRGTDVMKALALGATAVLLGRPYIYGLATGGEEGVKTVIQQIQNELDVSMALSGVSSISEILSSLIVNQG